MFIFNQFQFIKIIILNIKYMKIFNYHLTRARAITNLSADDITNCNDHRINGKLKSVSGPFDDDMKHSDLWEHQWFI